MRAASWRAKRNASAVFSPIITPGPASGYRDGSDTAGVCGSLTKDNSRVLGRVTLGSQGHDLESAGCCQQLVLVWEKGKLREPVLRKPGSGQPGAWRSSTPTAPWSGWCHFLPCGRGFRLYTKSLCTRLSWPASHQHGKGGDHLPETAAPCKAVAPHLSWSGGNAPARWRHGPCCWDWEGSPAGQ